MRICTISANFGNFDQDFSQFDVKQTLPEGWEVDTYRFDDLNYPYRKQSLSDRLRSKIPKMLGHEMVKGQYDYYIWMDSNFSLNDENSIKYLVDQCSMADIAFYKHYQRDNVYDEFQFVKTLMKNGDQYLLKRYNGECIIEQEQFYSKRYDLKLLPLFATGVFIYNRLCIQTGLLNEWFYHCCRYNALCQLSLPYLLRSYQNVPINIIQDNLVDNPIVKYHWSHS